MVQRRRALRAVAGQPLPAPDEDWHQVSGDGKRMPHKPNDGTYPTIVTCLSRIGGFCFRDSRRSPGLSFSNTPRGMNCRFQFPGEMTHYGKIREHDPRSEPGVTRRFKRDLGHLTSAPQGETPTPVTMLAILKGFNK